MTFAHPGMLWLLAAVPPGLLLFFWWSWRTRQKLMTRFIQARLLPGLTAGVSPGREKFRAGCLILAAICLIVALARPQWGYEQQEVRQRGLDILVAIDTSKSMLAADIAPNRLARAKLAAQDLMQLAKSDRLGIVAFAGTAFLQCPLTIDDSAFRRSLEMLDVTTLPVGGTALAEAIETALKAFQKGDNFKVLVLFTDGEDHDSDAMAAARKAAEAGLRIFTVGIGSVEGDLLRAPTANGQSDFVRDQSGNVVKSRLNEDLLREIAGAAGGFYLPLRGAHTMEALYRQGLEPLPRSESQEKWVKRAREQYHWPLALAIAALIIEFLFPDRKAGQKPSPRSVAGGNVLSVRGLVLLLLLAPLAGSASTSRALRDYRSGNYRDALQEYERALEKRSDEPRLHFNAGTAAYRNGQFDAAAEHFAKALGSSDLALQQKAYYNLGNALYRLGEQAADPSKMMESWQEALKRFESSLKLDAQDADARYNHDYVQKKLEELKQQQQQSNQDQQQDQNGADQEQKQQEQQRQSNDAQQQEQQQDSARQQQQQQQEQADANEDQRQQTGQGDEPQNQQARGSGGEQSQDRPDSEPLEADSPPGQMTPQQARQLLDAQKDDEKMLPVAPEEKGSLRRRPGKDW